MSEKIRRIAVNTGGGDAPGLNAVIRAIVLSAKRRGWEVLGITKGYNGLLGDRNVVTLDREAVRGIHHLGGTILGTTNRGDPFAMSMKMPDGSRGVVDRSDEVVANFGKLGLDALIAIGGDGSMELAHRFSKLGLPVIGVPKTIDNDLDGTVLTFGFLTAVHVATAAIDRLHTTAEAHERVFVVEVMGRYAGWIAIYAGLAGGADVILMPEIPYDLEAVGRAIMNREARGRKFSIVVAAEGAKPRGGGYVTKKRQPEAGEVRLGGIAEQLAAQIEELTGKESRSVVLGHLQRGGRPISYDRLISLRFGAAAVRMVAERNFGTMVALDPPDVLAVPLETATSRMKTVPLDSDLVVAARQIGICLGDE
ncbi:MAG: ATP-dependent 6-phosphofructokinase [Thermoanaerobaculia bacterium]